MSDTEHCPRCGIPLPADAPEGKLCPRCLLRIGFAAEGGAVDEAPPTALDEGPAEGDPQVIGPYRILDKLGEGGMGVVYVAEQTEPVRRRVALKLIKLGMDTKQVIARFEAERQALALMNHPNVAKVFDAGVTERGRPYFVMEYVPGIPITEYCDLRCLSVRERLGLFVQVCEAIHHAHQKGIIHRDVKPTNVLVSTEDDKPALKVIDFGVAKATSQRLTERTLYTQQGILIGTPEYMSPEQARTTALDVDTRTDIYSLGVLLYELLVGALPFDAETLRRAATIEMLRIIREEDPPKPTTKFSSLGDTAPEVARRRHTDIRTLVRQLRGELEWITMRALEKDPARRYGSASEFAADVRRHLADEAVIAGPPSRAYRLRKFARKHRRSVAAVAAIFGLLVGGLAVSTAMYLRSEAARQRAEAEALRNRLDSAALQAALREDGDGYRERSRQALEVHRTMLDPDDPEYAVYMVNRLVILDALYFGSQPSEGPDLETLLGALARESAEAVQRTLPSRDPRLIEALDVLAGYFGNNRQEAESEWACREALALRRQSLPPGDPGFIANLEKLAPLVEEKSAAMRAEDHPAEADPLEEEALDLRREALGIQRLHPGLDETPLEESIERLADLAERRGNRLMAAGDPVAAAPLLREALDLIREVRPTGSRRAAVVQCQLGRCLVWLERFPEAEEALLESYRVFEGELGGRSASLQMTANALVELYEAWERPAEAGRYRALLTHPTVLAVRELDPLQGGEPSSSRRTGSTVGFSTLLAGRSLWVFSLTSAQGGCETGRYQCGGAWSWTGDLSAADGIGRFRNGTGLGGRLAEPIPHTAEEKAYNQAHVSEDCVEDRGSAWVLLPGAIAADPARGRALVFYHRGMDRQPPWSFSRRGTSIAIWTDPTGRPARLPHGGNRVDLFSAEEPAWGSGAVAVGDDLYAYACERRGSSCPCLVARAPLKAALEREAWRFHVGSGRWSADWREARPVMEAAPYLTVHWNEHLGSYLAVHAVPGEKTIALRTAQRPEGPWSEPRLYVVGLAPPPHKHHNAAALAHPEFARDGGRVEYITYFRDTADFWTGETRLVEITFE